MGGPTSKDLVETVRSAGDIARLIGDYVPLKQRGARLLGLCPFHQEKTPSFSVDPSQQLFYCFGCHTGGDIFKFVMLYDKVSFPEAVEALAARFGVPLPASRPDPQEDLKRRLLDMHAAAAAFYRGLLEDPEAGARGRAYLERRGLSPEIAARLQLGLAPAGWDALRTHLAARRFRPEEMASGGLCLPRKDGSGHYDRFRERLLFPIRDASGRTVAFGGRALGDAEPKYLNSPETPIYVKGELLYGLDLSREAIRREGLAVVVEGYMDLAACLRAGIEHAVATLGTAFTPAQARLLSRVTTRVVVCYDGDAAGQTAAAKSVDLLLERGFEVRIADLPTGQDPDDLVRSGGPEALRERVLGALPYLEFLLAREVRKRDLSLPSEKAAAASSLLPHVARLASAVERDPWIRRIAETLDVDEEAVRREMRAAARESRPAVLRVRPPSPDVPREVEARLIRLLLRDSSAAERLSREAQPGDLGNGPASRIVDILTGLRAAGAPASPATVFGALQDEADRAWMARVALDEAPGREEEDPEDELAHCLHVLRRERLERERREIGRRIRQEAADPAVLHELLVRKSELDRVIDTLA